MIIDGNRVFKISEIKEKGKNRCLKNIHKLNNRNKLTSHKINRSNNYRLLKSFLSLLILSLFLLHVLLLPIVSNKIN